MTSGQSEEKEVIFDVEGIMCTGCAMDMETVLLDTDGILDASVGYADGTVTISYDPDLIDLKSIIRRVEKFGFKSTIRNE